MQQTVAAADRPAVRSERYQGEFEDDERHGHGTCVFADGGKYTGAWRTGTIEGKGRYEHANGDVFEGEFSNRRRVRGRLQLADGGDEYENSKKVLIGDVDCTVEANKQLCEDQAVEGYPTARSAWNLAQSRNVDTPIIDEVYAMLHEGKDLRQALFDLTTRVSKAED